MDHNQTLARFLDFFEQRGHHRITSSTLIPPDPDDPVLFTTSGMHPLTPVLEGRQHHPLGRRLCNVQRCLRTTDLDEVGDSTHLTLFQMLGSWSVGDYPHSQSLDWGIELLTDGFGIRPDLLSLTVFGGSDECPPDEDSERVWLGRGLPPNRVVRLSENWWSNGPRGLCGPDSELFVWRGGDEPVGDPSCDVRWVEVWNHVHMRFRRDEHGRLHELDCPNVDTGMGFERLLSVLQDTESVYETSLLSPWCEQLSELYGLDGGGLRRVVDHLRSGVVMVGDGVRPSNLGRGYVLRRLIRRSLSVLRSHGVAESLGSLPVELVSDTLDWFEQPTGMGEVVIGVLGEEERRYRSLLERGRRVVARQLRDGPISEDGYRWLWDTHGLPREVVDELRDGIEMGEMS